MDLIKHFIPDHKVSSVEAIRKKPVELPINNPEQQRDNHKVRSLDYGMTGPGLTPIGVIKRKLSYLQYQATGLINFSLE